MTNLPADWSEVTIWHTLVYYTFMPMLACVGLGVLSAAPLWYFGVITFGEAIVYPWCVASIAFVYISLLGDYVMPAETYRKYRSGEWGNE